MSLRRNLDMSVKNDISLAEVFNHGCCRVRVLVYYVFLHFLFFHCHALRFVRPHDIYLILRIFSILHRVCLTTRFPLIPGYETRRYQVKSRLVLYYAVLVLGSFET